MPSNPKIVVVKMREVIYTIILVFLILALILCMILMFSPQKNPTSPKTENISSYIAGVYSAPLPISGQNVLVEVSVDSDHINGIRLIPLDDSIMVSYPLLQSSSQHIISQILSKQSLNEISVPKENLYTAELLLSAISSALSKAQQ